MQSDHNYLQLHSGVTQPQPTFNHYHNITQQHQYQQQHKQLQIKGPQHNNNNNKNKQTQSPKQLPPTTPTKKQQIQIQIIVNGSDGSWNTFLIDRKIVDLFSGNELKGILKQLKVKYDQTLVDDKLLDMLKSECIEILYKRIPDRLNKILSSSIPKEIIDQYQTYTIPCYCKPCLLVSTESSTLTTLEPSNYILACRCYLCHRGTPNIIKNHDTSSTTTTTTVTTATTENKISLIKKLMVVSFYTLVNRFENIKLPDNHGKSSERNLKRDSVYQFILVHKNLLGIGTSIELFNLFKAQFSSILDQIGQVNNNLNNSYFSLPLSLKDPWNIVDNNEFDNEFLEIIKHNQKEFERRLKQQQVVQNYNNKRKQQETNSNGDRDSKKSKALTSQQQQHIDLTSDFDNSIIEYSPHTTNQKHIIGIDVSNKSLVQYQYSNHDEDDISPPTSTTSTSTAASSPSTSNRTLTKYHNPSTAIDQIEKEYLIIKCIVDYDNGGEQQEIIFQISNQIMFCKFVIKIYDKMETNGDRITKFSFKYNNLELPPYHTPFDLNMKTGDTIYVNKINNY